MSSESTEFLHCRDCGYDLRAAVSAQCPECGLDVETSRAFPSLARAGLSWTKRAERRLSIGIALWIATAIVITSLMVWPVPIANTWLRVAIDLIPLTMMALVPFSLTVNLPDMLGVDWRRTRRIGRGGPILIVAVLFTAATLDSQITSPTLSLVWMCVTGAVLFLGVSSVPIVLVPIALLLPSRSMASSLWCIAWSGIAAAIFLPTMLVIDHNVDLAARGSLPIVAAVLMVFLMATSLGGGFILLLLLRWRLAVHRRRIWS